MSYPIIRQATSADAVHLAALGYVAWERGIMPLYEDGIAAIEAQKQRLSRYCRESVRDIIVAELRGEILGWCSRIRGRAYVPYLFVTPYLQGQGIGGLLLRRMERIFELEGHTAAQLETPADHLQAVRFYENQGYQILAMKVDGQVLNSPFSNVRLEKALAPFSGALNDDEA